MEARTHLKKRGEIRKAKRVGNKKKFIMIGNLIKWAVSLFGGEIAEALSDGDAVDLDGDGLVDSVAMDTDGDGSIDNIALDTDNDGDLDTLI